MALAGLEIEDFLHPPGDHGLVSAISEQLSEKILLFCLFFNTSIY
jgi:hypothetical protein